MRIRRSNRSFQFLFLSSKKNSNSWLPFSVPVPRNPLWIFVLGNWNCPNHPDHHHHHPRRTLLLLFLARSCSRRDQNFSPDGLKINAIECFVFDLRFKLNVRGGQSPVVFSPVELAAVSSRESISEQCSFVPSLVVQIKCEGKTKVQFPKTKSTKDR